jgi:chromosome segregation ATPase
MTDDQIWALAQFIGQIVAAAVFVAWWFKGELAGREIRGLKAENDALKTNVRLAETAAAAETKGLRAENDALKTNVRLAESLSQSEVKGLQAQIGQLNERCAVMAERLAYAEDRLKARDDKLADVKAELEEAQRQNEANKPELVSHSLRMATSGTDDIIASNNEIIRALAAPKWSDFAGTPPPLRSPQSKPKRNNDDEAKRD